MARALAAAALLALAPGCSVLFAPGSYSSGATDAAGHDAGVDGGHDTGTPDGGTDDANVDADVDAGSDAGVDAFRPRIDGGPCSQLFGGPQDGHGNALATPPDLLRLIEPATPSEIRLDVLASTADATIGTPDEGALHDVSVTVGSGGQLVVGYVNDTHGEVMQAFIGDLGVPGSLSSIVGGAFDALVEVRSVDVGTSPAGDAHFAAIGVDDPGMPADHMVDCAVGGGCVPTVDLVDSSGAAFDGTSVAFVTVPVTAGSGMTTLSTIAYGFGSLIRPDAAVFGYALGPRVTGTPGRFALGGGMFLDIVDPGTVNGASISYSGPVAIAAEGDPTADAWLIGHATAFAGVALAHLDPTFTPAIEHDAGDDPIAAAGAVVPDHGTVFLVYAVDSGARSELQLIAADPSPMLDWIDLSGSGAPIAVSGFGAGARVREIDMVAFRGDDGTVQQAFALWAAIVATNDGGARHDHVHVGAFRVCGLP